MQVISRSSNIVKVKLNKEENEVTCPICGATIGCRSSSGYHPCHECHRGAVEIVRD